MKNNQKRYPFLDLTPKANEFSEELEKTLCRVFRSGRYVGGSEVEQFESQLAREIGTSYAIGVGSGLDALRLILRALVISGRLNKGDEVVVAANSYIASVLAIMDAGLKPLPVDPDVSTMNLSGRDISRHLSRKIRAIMPVHLYGRVCMDAELEEICRAENMLVIEDCAQAIGARYKSQSVGSLGIAGGFSFYPTKNIGCFGDGGAVTTDNEEIGEIVRALGNYGSDRRYHNVYPGFNSRLDSMQAAILSLKLREISAVSDSRRKKAAIYREHINRPDVILPSFPDDPSECVWHQFVVRVRRDYRDTFRKKLLDEGVETDVHYPTGIHKQPCCLHLASASLPITEQLAAEVVSLPIGEHLSDKDIFEICEIINRC